MTTFVPVTAPAWGDAARSAASALESADAWAANEPVEALVRAFGGEPPSGTASERLAWLDRFSEEHWDFRAGQERNLARAVEFGEPTTELILAAAGALGMTSSIPPSASRFSHLLILGGLVRACLLRPRFAADLVRDGLEVGSISALSAFRPLRGDENELLALLDQSSKSNEMEVMQAGLMTAFDLGDPIEGWHEEEGKSDFATSLVRTWHRDGVPVRLVIAPSPEPQVRRANSADTYAYWADRCVQLQSEDSILLVTSSIYLPYQHAEAVRMLALPHGCSVETVGIDFSRHELGALRQPFTPANYLQEIRSAIRAVRALRDTALAMLGASPDVAR